jgi:hypothetical protein
MRALALALLALALIAQQANAKVARGEFISCPG